MDFLSFGILISGYLFKREDIAQAKASFNADISRLGFNTKSSKVCEFIQDIYSSS